MKATAVETLLQQALVHQHIQVKTMDEVHFEVLVVSEIFRGQSRLARQRTIFTVLGPYLQSGELHALALKTYTPEEWQKEEST